MGVEPNQVLRQDVSKRCVVRWCDVVRPSVPSLKQFRDQAIPAHGEKARRGGDVVHDRAEPEPAIRPSRRLSPAD